MKRRLAMLALAAAIVAAAAPAKASATPDAIASARTTIEAEVERIGRQSGGTLGMTALHLPGGQRLSVRGDEAFPMASTFKVAVAAAILDRVDHGTLALDRMIAIDRGMMVRSEVIADRFIHPGLAVSVANLLELMLTQSDNSATDILVDLAGGPGAVTGWLKAHGISGQHVERDTAAILRDYYGAEPAAKPGEPAETYLDKPAFNADARDTSTPDAMIELLDGLFAGRILSPASTDLLTVIMQRCRTGEGRIKGRLPEGTVVAHKTGTIGGTVNDVGIIRLPDGSRLLIAVFIKASNAPFAKREAAIADVARLAFDYFLIAPALAPKGQR